MLRVTVAVTRADSSTPGMRNASLLIPQLKGLSTVGYALTGSYPFAGSAQAEGRLTDASSVEKLWVGIEREIGAVAVSNGVQGQWGDVNNAIDYRYTKIFGSSKARLLWATLEIPTTQRSSCRAY